MTLAFGAELSPAWIELGSLGVGSGGHDTALLEAVVDVRRHALQSQTGARSDDMALFAELTERWQTDTRLSSSVAEMAMHPAYQRIIGMGRRAVPLILRELERRPHHWFWALAAITGERPVPPGDYGQVRKMTEAWLRWGKSNGLLR